MNRLLCFLRGHDVALTGYGVPLAYCRRCLKTWREW